MKTEKPVLKILQLIAEDIRFDRAHWDANRRQKWEESVERRKRDPFKSLIGTILSARNRDESTSMAVEALFSRYDTPEKLANVWDYYSLESFDLHRKKWVSQVTSSLKRLEKAGIARPIWGAGLRGGEVKEYFHS